MSKSEATLAALVIDDEPQMQRLLTITLEANGYSVTLAGNGKDALTMAAQRRHDIIILDLGLPDVSGIQVLRQIREWSQTPVMVLTVLDGEADKIDALDSGADDYITKPFSTGEFLARLRATLRRSDTGKMEKPVIQARNVTVDLTSRCVSRDGVHVKLTATEFALLRLFIQNAGRVLTHGYILGQIWGREHENDTQYLRLYVLRLRKKLEADAANPTLFITEPAVGYRFATE